MRTYCINLPDRKDRRQEVLPEFKKFGIDPIFFEAVRTLNGRDGCRMSHLKLFEYLVSLNNFPVMVCEDDVVFQNYPLQVLNSAFESLPWDWDALWLGATLTEHLSRYNDNLFRLRGGWTTHCIIYNNPNVLKYVLSHAEQIYKIDVFMADYVQKYFNCFITYPMIATQRAGHSDIINKFTDYSIIQERYDKYTQQDNG